MSDIFEHSKNPSVMETILELHKDRERLEAENEALKKDRERLEYVIDRRDFLWDCWSMTDDEVKKAIDEAMKE